MALPAYAAAGLGWLKCPDAAIIGALMILVPGLLITNSMRDIIYGDTNSGISASCRWCSPRWPSRWERRLPGI